MQQIEAAQQQQAQAQQQQAQAQQKGGKKGQEKKANLMVQVRMTQDGGRTAL